MVVQHRTMIGQQVAVAFEERFEDRMKRIAMSYRVESSIRAGVDSPWLTLRVDPGREIAVKNLLDEAGVEALVPMRKGPELRRRGRVLPPALLPVMGCYVLARCVVTDRALIGLKSFDHVRDVLGGCVSPRLVSAEEVNVFREKAEQGEYDWGKPTVSFKAGWKVRVTGGPFLGFVGTIISCRADGRGDAVVEVDVFNRATPVLTPLALLAKL